MLVVDFDFDLPEGEACFGHEILDFEVEIVVVYVFELIEVDGAVGVDALYEDCVGYDGDEQKDVVVDAAPFDYAEVAVEDGDDHDDGQRAVHEEVVDVAVYCFC
jgi:hypothetical protein